MRSHPVTFLMILFLFLPFSGMTQSKEYIVKHNGDTIYGKSIFVNYKFTRLKTTDGRKKIPTSEVHAVYQKNRKYLIYENPFVNQLLPYRVLADGEATLLFDDHSFLTLVDCLDFVVLEEELYPIDEYHLSDELWKEMASCDAFRKKYRAFKKERENKKLLVLNKKIRKKWAEMISFYNKNCGG